MAFRDDGDAQRARVDSLEDELARVRAELDRALAEARTPEVHGLPAHTPVWIEWRGTWWPGSVLQPLGNARYRIHYDGYGSKWDEDVDARRVAPRDRPPPGAGASTRWGTILLSLGFVAFVLIGLFVAISRSAPADITVRQESLGKGNAMPEG